MKDHYKQFNSNNILIKMQMPVQTHAGGLGSTTPDFICKLYTMIRQHPQTISFSEDGSEVHIYDKEKFTSQILKKTFRHDKWRSFIRQMNMYNFRKVNRGMQTYIFVNNIFRQGNEANFHKIKRKINTKEQQLYTQNNLEQDLKLLLKLQSQSLGIANNNSLLHSEINKNQEPQEGNSNNQMGENRMVQRVNNQYIEGNKTQRQSNSLNTLPSLTSTENKILGSNANYTNSLIYFLERTIKYRREGEQLCGEIKQNMEFIAKERKTMENKNILNAVKDSTQMIDEMANKFKQKIENYVDYKISELESNVQHFSNHFASHPDENIGSHQNNNNTPPPNVSINIDLLEYISGHSYQNIYDPIPKHYNGTTIVQGINLGIQKQQKHSKQSKQSNKKVNHSMMGSNYQSFSSNLIIPQPIQMNGNNKQYQERMKTDKKMGNREEGSKSEQKIKNPNINVIICSKKNQEEGSQSISISNKGTIQNNPGSIANNGNMSNIENVLGLTSLCSFSSINLEKQ